MQFNVALLQIAPFGDDQPRNLAKGIEACLEAKSRGADLALFPELWNIGGSVPSAGPAEAIGPDSQFLTTFAQLAQDLALNIAITYLEARDPLPRNSVTIFNRRGEPALHYSKVFICNFELEDGEVGCDIHCAPGESFPVCTLDGVNIGAMICADREFPEAATALMHNGAELIVVPNACTWDPARDAGLLTRALDNLAGIAMANYPGPAQGCSQARTCVAWRNGQPADTQLARAGEDEQILLVSFDVAAIREFRKLERWRMAYRSREKS